MAAFLGGDHVRRPMPSCRCLWRLYLHLEMSSWIAQHQQVRIRLFFCRGCIHIIIEDSVFLQAMIALAGACIHACRATGLHILAFEYDKDIFDALLAPMRRTVVIPQPEILPPDIVPWTLMRRMHQFNAL